MCKIDSVVGGARRGLLACALVMACGSVAYAQSPVVTGDVGISIIARDDMVRVYDSDQKDGQRISVEMVATNSWVDRLAATSPDEGDVVMMVMY